MKIVLNIIVVLGALFVALAQNCNEINENDSKWYEKVSYTIFHKFSSEVEDSIVNSYKKYQRSYNYLQNRTGVASYDHEIKYGKLGKEYNNYKVIKAMSKEAFYDFIQKKVKFLVSWKRYNFELELISIIFYVHRKKS